jgi:undecaprenyl-phosphate galactose phosphotransferase
MRIINAIQLMLLVLIDLAAYYTSLVLAILFRIYVFPLLTGILGFTILADTPDVELQAYISSFSWEHLSIVWIPITYLLVIAYEAPYLKRLPIWQETRHVFKAVTIACIIVFAFASLGKLSYQFSRILLICSWVMSLIIFPVFRMAGKKILFLLKIGYENVLILGAGDAGITVLKGLEREKNLGYRVIGFLDDDPEKIGSTIKTPSREYRVFGFIRHFKKFVNMMKISTLIVAIPSFESSRRTAIINEVQRYVPRVLIVPEIKGVALMNTELRVLFMEQLFLLKIRNNLKSFHSRLIKRLFDFIVSTLVIIAISPLLLGIFLLVRLTSPGGAFFSQLRPGKDGKIIKIYKFRTMYIDGDERLQKAIETDPKLAEEWRIFRKLKTYDPRVTSIGKLMRKFSLDELPQLFNVWKGQMSIVGPRPYMISEIDSLKDSADIILMARPGLCGLWQASGRNNLSFEERVKLESWYVLNWSIWLDIILMFKTAKVVLTAEGAY